MVCKASTQTTAESFTITSEVVSASGRCQVIAGGSDVHRVSAENWTNSPYEIAIDAKCAADNLRYYKDDSSHEDTWKTRFVVRSKQPGWGSKGPRVDGRSRPLTSLRQAVDQEIETNLSWGYPETELAATEVVSITVMTC